jgi:type II secretory pathway component PulF
MEDPQNPLPTVPLHPATEQPPAPAAAVLQTDYFDARRSPRRNVLREAFQWPWFWPISATAYLVIGLMLLGGFSLLSAVVFEGGREVGGAVILLGLLLLAASARLVKGIRRNRARTLFGYLEQAARLNLPLPAMLRAAESAETGGPRRAIRRLRARLEDGLPVARALDEAVAGTSPRMVKLVDAGERIGRLGAVLRRLVEQDRATPRRDPSETIFLQWYPLVLTIGVVGVTVVLAVFVLPKYQRILTDFHRPVPAIIHWFAASSDTLLIVCAVVGSLLLGTYVGRLTAAIFAPRLRRPAVVSFIIDSVRWHLPLVRGVEHGRGLADVCNVMADCLEAGHTPAQALADAKELKLNAVLRRRVRHWGERVESGVPLADAARASGMPSLLVGMLASAPGADVPRVLQFLARYYESRFGRSTELLRAAIIPTMAIGFGAVVLVMACTLLLPMIDMADAMCAKLSQGGP